MVGWGYPNDGARPSKGVGGDIEKVGPLLPAARSASRVYLFFTRLLLEITRIFAFRPGLIGVSRGWIDAWLTVDNRVSRGTTCLHGGDKMGGPVKLLPCPFCGAEAEFERIGTRRVSTIISCTMCGASMETGEEWDHGKAWNRRVASERE